jgi:hypothetical protein
MATFVFIPGAGGVAWYWHRVVPLLKDAKHDAIAVDLRYLLFRNFCRQRRSGGIGSLGKSSGHAV